MSQRAVYDPSTRSYRGSSTDIRIMPTSNKMKCYDGSLMNGSPFGPFNKNQPIDGKPYREAKVLTKKK